MIKLWFCVVFSSIVIYLTLSERLATRLSTWSNLVVNKLRLVKIPPFGPRLYLLKCQYKWYSNQLHVNTLLFHNFFIIDSISNIDIGSKRKRGDCRIEIQDIRGSLFLMKMSINSLYNVFRYYVNKRNNLNKSSIFTCIKVVFPEPAIPMQRMTGGCFFSLFSADMSKSFVVFLKANFFFSNLWFHFNLFAYSGKKQEGHIQVTSRCTARYSIILLHCI